MFRTVRSIPKLFTPIVLWLAGACASAPVPSQSALEIPGQRERFPTDEYITALLEEVVPEGHPGGILVGIVDPDGTHRVIGYGRSGLDGSALDTSMFEIGSITKVFTGVLLADMARRGEVNLQEPLGNLLQPRISIRSATGTEITLLDVATHTSGLPVMPHNFPEGDPVRAYADYTVEQLRDFLSNHEVPREPGEIYEYSNLLSTLGHALAGRAAMPYEVLLRQRVLDPLEMRHTAVTPSPEMELRLSRGHTRRGDLAPYFVAPVFDPSGGLKSTIDDMLRFASANLADADTPVHGALHDARIPRRPVDGEYVGLAWGVNQKGTMVGHSGGTFGFSSFINIDTEKRRAIVVLANFAGRDANLVGVHLLDPENNPRPPSR
jgi:serine-type D-Ala-D-Ala carboxypeptidase/endopeptidase